ncbi:TorF family putative porin [Burkholderiaceae bacterium DAT-1]|nr:TorF family putative porin [Burkholderiaceae bacterium DAT-1]
MQIKTRLTSKSLALLMTSALTMGIAHAEDAAPAPDYTFTGNASLTSEYIYRGIAQTNNKAAIQGGFDFAHKSGFYLGTWGSSISWLSDAGAGSFPTELDVYGGYKGAVTDDIGFDVGGLQYYYPGKLNDGFFNPNTFEVYGALTWKFATLKYSRTTGNLFGTATATTNSHGSGYVDLTLAPDLGDGWIATAHIGRQTVTHFGDASYNDWKLGIAKDVGVGTVSAAVSGTNAKGDQGEFYRNAYGTNLGKTRFVLSFTKTM